MKGRRRQYVHAKHKYFNSKATLFQVRCLHILYYRTFKPRICNWFEKWGKNFHPKAVKHLQGHYLDRPFFLWRNISNSGLGRITVEVSRSHTDTHMR